MSNHANIKSTSLVPEAKALRFDLDTQFLSQRDEGQSEVCKCPGGGTLPSCIVSSAAIKRSFSQNAFGLLNVSVVSQP